MPGRFYGEILRWKKRKMSRRAGAGRKGRRRKKLHCPGFISSHYDPRALSPPPPSLSSSPASSLPSAHPTLSPSATSSDIKLFIVHNGASSFVKSKKKKRNINGRNRRRERFLPCLRGKGVLRQICRSPSSVSSPSRPLVPVASFLFFFFFFLQRTRKHDRRAIDPKTLYGETRQRNAEYRRKFTFVMACNKYLFDRTLFQLFIWIDIKAYRERMDGGRAGS